VSGIPARLGTRPTVSFEYFPPKGDQARHEALKTAIRLSVRRPDFVSVTYGAGGSDRSRTREMVADVCASHVSGRHRCPVMPHLTCVGHTRREISELLEGYAAFGVTDVLALAGDPRPDLPEGDFRYAMDLIEQVRDETDFGVGVAAFPEVHPRSPDRATDRRRLAEKLKQADFGITQFFFDADHYRRMADELADLGCGTPVVAGVIPVTNPASVKRFADMNGTDTPSRLWQRLEEVNGDERLRIAIDSAAGLVQELLDLGAPGIHLYTLNVPEAVEGVLDALGIGAVTAGA
jgi:methylenetetrahydrofolate reductase (NADPH)